MRHLPLPLEVFVFNLHMGFSSSTFGSSFSSDSVLPSSESFALTSYVQRKSVQNRVSFGEGGTFQNSVTFIACKHTSFTAPPLKKARELTEMSDISECITTGNDY